MRAEKGLIQVLSGSSVDSLIYMWSRLSKHVQVYSFIAESPGENDERDSSCVFLFSINTHTCSNLKLQASFTLEQQQPQLMTFSIFSSIFYPPSLTLRSLLCNDRQKKELLTGRNSLEHRWSAAHSRWQRRWQQHRRETQESNAVETEDCLLIESNFVCLFSIKKDCKTNNRAERMLDDESERVVVSWDGVKRQAAVNEGGKTSFLFFIVLFAFLLVRMEIDFPRPTANSLAFLSLELYFIRTALLKFSRQQRQRHHQKQRKSFSSPFNF